MVKRPHILVAIIFLLWATALALFPRPGILYVLMWIAATLFLIGFVLRLFRIRAERTLRHLFIVPRFGNEVLVTFDPNFSGWTFYHENWNTNEPLQEALKRASQVLQRLGFQDGQMVARTIEARWCNQALQIVELNLDRSPFIKLAAGKVWKRIDLFSDIGDSDLAGVTQVIVQALLENGSSGAVDLFPARRSESSWLLQTLDKFILGSGRKEGSLEPLAERPSSRPARTTG